MLASRVAVLTEPPELYLKSKIKWVTPSEAKKVKASTTPAPSTSTPTKKTTPINGTKKVAEAGLIDSKQVAALLKKHACTSCHAEATRVVGPPFTEVANRNYTNEQILELVYHPKQSAFCGWPQSQINLFRFHQKFQNLCQK